MERKLYRSRTDVIIGGVCAGLGDYLKVDPTVVRLVFVLTALFGGHSVLLYLVMWLIMPLAPEGPPAERPAVAPEAKPQ
jgi:phage shock protein C